MPVGGRAFPGPGVPGLQRAERTDGGYGALTIGGLDGEQRELVVVGEFEGRPGRAVPEGDLADDLPRDVVGDEDVADVQATLVSDQRRAGQQHDAGGDEQTEQNHRDLVTDAEGDALAAGVAEKHRDDGEGDGDQHRDRGGDAAQADRVRAHGAETALLGAWGAVLGAWGAVLGAGGAVLGGAHRPILPGGSGRRPPRPDTARSDTAPGVGDHGASTRRPDSMPKTTSWARSRAPSLSMARLTWVRTVAGLITSSSAISSFDRPVATQATISRSRSVSSPSRGCGAGRRPVPAKRSITRRVTLGDSSEPPSATTRTARSSSAGSTSLSRKPLAPPASASKTYSSSSKVVSTTTRTEASPGSAVISRSAASPSSTGIRMSISTTSGTVRRMVASPDRPSSASPTSAVSGSVSSSARRPIRTSAWSSTTTTRT